MLSKNPSDFKVGRKVIIYHQGKPNMIGIDCLIKQIGEGVFLTTYHHFVFADELLWTEEKPDQVNANFGNVKVYIPKNEIEVNE